MVFSLAAQNHFFQKVQQNTKAIQGKTSTKKPTYRFNYNALHGYLLKSPKVNTTAKTPHTIVRFPNINGDLEAYAVMEASVMHEALQNKYPDIRSYVGYNVKNPTKRLRFSLSKTKGLTGLMLDHKSTIYFNPDAADSNAFSVSRVTDLKHSEAYICQTKAYKTAASSSLKSKTSKRNSTIKKTYRIAVSVTGEYTEFSGGTLEGVNANLVASLTNVNAVFENDLNIRLELIPENDVLIFSDPDTDPYTTASNYGIQLHNTLLNTIGSDSFDLGHVLSAGSFAGNANCIGCVCNDQDKGRAFSVDGIPSGFNFDINLFAHEIGHQFGANHTWTSGFGNFNEDTGVAIGDNEGTGVQMEPGSGTTVMGYAGIAGNSNVQPNSDPYFHAISISQIEAYVATTGCAINENSSNTLPSVNAGPDITLPIGTPFKLTGSAEDADNDVLTYCWEQMNDNNARTSDPDPDLKDPNAVLFRSFPPTLSNTRYFINLTDLNFGLNSGRWEKVPNVTRTADFRLTVRDNNPNGGGTNFDDLQVLFDENYGPFEIISQNPPEDFLKGSPASLVIGALETVRWNVKNTDKLPGASTVNIYLSIDGGTTFDRIASNVPNTGSYDFLVPDTPSTNCRFMVEPTNASFFAYSPRAFNIGLNTRISCNNYSSNENLNIAIPDDTGFLSVDNTINIPDSGNITDINIRLNVSHEHIGDLGITLESPNGTEIVLFADACGSSDNLITTFDDDSSEFDCSRSADGINQRLFSTSDLAAFNGENAQGNWILRLGDFAGEDVGILNSWSIEICNSSVAPITANDAVFGNFTLVPNPVPTSGIFRLRAPTIHNPKDLRIEVFNTRGQLVYQQDLPETEFLNERIFIANAQAGLYFLTLHDGSDSFVKKLIIQ